MVEQLQKIDWAEMTRRWCSCDSMYEDLYSFHEPPFKFCLICKTDECDNDHYHCGSCLKLSQVG